MRRAQRRGVKTWADTERWLRRYAAPLDLMDLGQIGPPVAMRFLDWVSQLELAPNSKRHVLGAVSQVLDEAVAEGLLGANALRALRRYWPRKADRPGWDREAARFEVGEAVRLLFDERVPADRRVLYAVKLLAGLRHGEVARLQWRDLEPAAPLGRLMVRVTKTGVPRTVPVHDLLGRVLERWRAAWPRWYGRDPRQGPPFPADLMVPTRSLRARLASTSHHDFLRDLARLGLRRRRGHDLRRTFISHAQECGASRDLLRHVTHGRPAAVLDQYSTFTWAALCAEISRISWPEYDGRQLALPGLATGAEMVGPVGIEPTADGLKERRSGSRVASESTTLRRARLQGLAAVEVAKAALARGQTADAAAALEEAVSTLSGYRRRAGQRRYGPMARGDK